MTNLYLWFPEPQERRDYVVKLLGIEPVVLRRNTKKARLEAQELEEEQKAYLDDMETGMYQSPWLDLGGEFYMGRIPEEYREQVHPWLERLVWEKGYRRIYTLKSYMHRPGDWLVLQFRESKSGRLAKQTIQESFPRERIGFNVPIPMRNQLKLQLREVSGLLDSYDYSKAKGTPKTSLLVKALEIMERARNFDPTLFSGHNVYLWERLAWAWEELGDMRKADQFLRIQASLQPTRTDAWLNLGAFYAQRGMWEPAVKAYMDGLQIDPRDEHISHNLATLMGDRGMVQAALTFIEGAIGANPDQMLNYKVKGDFLLERGHIKQAKECYQAGLGRVGVKLIKLDCFTGLAAACIELKEPDQAKQSLKSALCLEPKHFTALMMLAELYLQEKNWQEAGKLAQQALKVLPHSSKACTILAKACTELGDSAQARWFSARAKREAKKGYYH